MDENKGTGRDIISYAVWTFWSVLQISAMWYNITAVYLTHTYWDLCKQTLDAGDASINTIMVFFF